MTLDHVYAAYGRDIALRDVSLTVYERDFLGVIGPNGGGKTTLVNVMLGLKKPVSGTVSYFRDGESVSEIAMGYLPQYSDIDKKFPISVYEVVLSGLSRQKRLLRPYTKAQHAQVASTIARLELDGLERRAIGTLSGGQLQRVLLARAIVSMPEMVILDEPSTYIDKRFQEQMYKILGVINDHCAIVMVSHDIGTILQNVKDVACVSTTLHYHPSAEVSEDELQGYFGGAIELLGHGDMPYKSLKPHEGKE